ncbi:MAG: complement resistance protein TraT [Leptospirillia bacterium]
MKARRLIFAGLATFGLLFASGCATLDKAYVGTVGAVDPDKVKLKQATRWLNPQPNFRMVSQDKMVVFLRVRNSSGSELDIRRDVQFALEDLGYQVTRNPDEAQYVMNLDIRYYGENARADGGKATLAAGVGGAVVGGIIGHQSRHGGSGAAVGAIAAGMLFDVAAQRNKIREFDVVVDTRIGERVKGGVQTTRKSSDASAVGHAGSSRGGSGYEGGVAVGGTEETQSAVFEEDFLYSQNRLLVYTSKMNLTPEEAAPVLEDRLIRALSNILP